MTIETIRTSRRQLLMGLAASAGAAAIATGVVAAESQGDPENPELVRLADMLPDTAGELTAACNAYAEAVAASVALWPQPPATILADYSNSGDIERGITDAAVMPDGSYPADDERPRKLISASELRWNLDHVERDLRRKRKKYPLSPEARFEGEAFRARLLARLTDVEVYEAGKARARAAVRWEAVCARKQVAEDAMRNLARAIMAEDARTIAGIIIKAQALTAWHHYPPARFLDIIDQRNVAVELADALLRVAGQ